MAKHPKIQEKVAEEVDRVVGRDRPPSLEDRGKLVYSEAALYEILRFSSVVPVGLIHATMEDTTLGKISPDFFSIIKIKTDMLKCQALAL